MNISERFILRRELREQVQDLRLDRDVEGGDRFVGDDDLGLQREGAGDGDALALAAGELVRVLLHEARGEADPLHEFGHAIAGDLRGGADAVDQQRLGERGEDGHARVERRVGSWNTICRSRRTPHLGGGAAVRFLPSRMTVPAVVGSSCMMVRARVDLPQPDSPTRPRTSPWLRRQRDAVDRLDGADLTLEQEALVDGEVRADVAEFENRVGHGRRGSDFAGLDAQAGLGVAGELRGAAGGVPAGQRRWRIRNGPQTAQPGRGFDRSGGRPGMV
jgi:hypothetical protein